MAVKPTKEEEEKLKNVLEPKNLSFSFMDDKETPITEKISDFFVYSVWYKIQDAWHEFKYTMQRLFRKNGLSNLDIWNCNSTIIEQALCTMKAFRLSKRHGYPHDVNGEEEWNAILDTIISRLEFWLAVFNNDFDEELCAKHNLEYPYKEKIENKYVSYEFESSDGSILSTKDLDYDEKDSKYTYRGRKVGYYNSEANKKLHEYADEGLHLFVKWLPNMWD